MENGVNHAVLYRALFTFCLHLDTRICAERSSFGTIIKISRPMVRNLRLFGKVDSHVIVQRKHNIEIMNLTETKLKNAPIIGIKTLTIHSAVYARIHVYRNRDPSSLLK